MKYSAHVQHPKGSGYMLGGSQFEGTEEEARKQALDRYLKLVDGNSFGRNALEKNPEPIMVLLIPGSLRGPDMMAYMGFCNVWNEDGSDAFEVEEPEYVAMANSSYKG